MNITEISQRLDVNGFMAGLIDSVDGYETETELTTRLQAKAAEIRAFAAQCEERPLSKQSSLQMAEFQAKLEADNPPEQRLAFAWHWMMQNIVDCNTQVMVRATVILGMPVLAAYL